MGEGVSTCYLCKKRFISEPSAFNWSMNPKDRVCFECRWFKKKKRR